MYLIRPKTCRNYFSVLTKRVHTQVTSLTSKSNGKNECGMGIKYKVTCTNGQRQRNITFVESLNLRKTQLFGNPHNTKRKT